MGWRFIWCPVPHLVRVERRDRFVRVLELGAEPSSSQRPLAAAAANEHRSSATTDDEHEGYTYTSIGQILSCDAGGSDLAVELQEIIITGHLECLHVGIDTTEPIAFASCLCYLGLSPPANQA